MKMQSINHKNKYIRNTRFLSMMVTLLLAYSWCEAQYFFENAGNVSLPNAVGVKPNHIAKGYFNNDNHLDFAATTGAKNQVTVFINNGLGNGFATPVDYGIGSSGINPRFVTTAHLQNGNITDLITANFGSDDISILPGNKNGTFQSAQCFKVGKAPWSVAVGNFDKEPKPDLVVANTGFDSVFNWYCSNYLSVLWNYDHNTGTVSDVTQVEVGNAPKSVVVGKFNKDGLDDIAVANMLSNTVTILIADDKTKKQGTFIKQQTIDLDKGSCPFFLCYREDFDELFVCNYFTYDVAVYKKDVSGNFNFFKKFPVGMGPASIDFGYFNGDNELDMAVLNMSSDNVSIHKGIGKGDFEAINDYYLAGNSPHSLVAGEFFDYPKGFAFAGSINSKKDDDLLIADFGNGKIIRMESQYNDFSGPKSFEVGSSPVFISAAQLNEPAGSKLGPTNDNSLDLIIVNENSNSVSVLMGDGKGGFDHNLKDVQVGKSPKSLAIGDFDGDNKEDDVAVANYGDKSLSILLDKNDDGMLINANTIFLNEAPTSIAVGDFIGNGRKDLAVVSFSSVFILTYVTPANFKEVKQLSLGIKVLTTGFKPNAICTFDFDGNKISDIAAADFTSNKVHIWQAVGNGDFKLFDIVTVGTNPRFIVGGNFYGNGDGDDDLAIANFGDSSVSILRYEKPKFVAEQPIKVGSKPCFIAVGHLQNASETDLAVVNQGSKSISMLKPNGNGKYSEVGRVATGREPASVVIGNFNKNGIPDMAVTYKYCFSVSSKNNCFDPPQPISIPCPGKIGFVTIYNQ